MKSKIVHGLTTGGIISLVLVVFFVIGLFGTWNTSLSDQLFTQKTPRSDIVIIAIDDKSINNIGRWPWNRSVHSKLLTLLSNPLYKPKVIGFDVSFFEPSDPEDDKKLQQALNLHKMTLASENNNSRLLMPIKQFSDSSSTGLVNILMDSDGITRRTNIINNGEKSFALNIVNNFSDNVSIPQFLNSTKINFAGKPGTFAYLSYSDVLNGSVDLKIFKDKIVLIGATAPNLHDEYQTPVSSGIPMPGVEIHANTIQTILNADYLFEESKFIVIITFVFITLLLSVIFSLLGIIPTIVLAVFALIVYFIYVIFSFDHNIIRNIIYPPLAIILSGIGNIGYKYLSESKQKKFIRKAFSFYLSESVLKEVLNNPDKLKLGGERKEVTILFSDIAGFTTISEKLDPEKLTNLLNQYLTEMTNIVLENQGVLDKYIGDSVMAFWGAPLKQENHALLACKCAIEMMQKLKKSDIYKFDIRIGINTGEAIVGNMGSENRFDYTVLGDTVNIASRLEGLNKNYQTHIIISEATYQKVKESVVVKKLDKVKVKGKTKPIEVYELLKLK